MSASSSRLPGYTKSSKNLFAVVSSLQGVPVSILRALEGSGLDLKKDSVRIIPNSSGGVVVHPEDLRSHDFTQEWTSVSGFMQIVSTQVKTVKRISVDFVARQRLTFERGNPRAEEDIVFSNEVALDEVPLRKGVTIMEFSVAFPHSTATHEDASFASVEHYLVGTVVGGTTGVFGSRNLVGEAHIYLAAAPSPNSDMEILRLNQHAELFIDQLGPVSLDVFSSRFTVAAPLSISLTLPSPPPTLKIHAIKCYIAQRIDLTSFRDPTRKETVRRPKAVILEKGWKEPFGKIRNAPTPLFDASAAAAKDGARSWTFEETGRVPGGTQLRPSTHPNTASWVKVSNELVLDVVFSLTPVEPSDPPEIALVATVLKRPVDLAGCSCLPGRILLPDYTLVDLDASPVRFGEKQLSHLTCKCDEPFEQLLLAEAEDRRRDQTPAASSSSEGGRTAGRKIGEDY